MASSLEHLVAEGVVSEVVARLKSGKEADVYVVRYGDNVVAAKVYKDCAHRSFKNNAAYKEGRTVRSSRSQRAIDRGSKFGKEAAEDAWKAAEAATLYKLHAAGVRVPTPILFVDGVLLMELVLGSDGEAAPRLIDMDLTQEQANAAYLDMLSQLVKILSCDLIHGDLSPYNVLWSTSGPTIIDFPQIVSASHNSNSESFFLRDARNILDHFVNLDPSLRSRSGDAREIWRAYVRRELTPDFMPSGRAFIPEPRPRVVEQRAPRDSGARGPSHGPAPRDGGPRPSSNSPRDHFGPRPQNDSRGPRPQNDSRGPRPQNDGRGPLPQNDGRGPRPQNDGRGPRPQNDSRGPLPQNDNRGPRPQNDGRGPRPQNDGRGPRPQNDGRGPRPQNDGRGPRPQNDGRGPRPQNDGRGPRRPSAPEVIVLQRRSPVAASVAEQPKPPAFTDAAPSDATDDRPKPHHRRRRRT